MAPGEIFSHAPRFCLGKRSTLWAFPWDSVCWIFWPHAACSLCQPLSQAFDSSLAVCHGSSGVSASLGVAIACFELPGASPAACRHRLLEFSSGCCYRRKCVPPSTHVLKSCPLVLPNVAVFADKVLKEIIKTRSLGWALIQYDRVLVRGGE